MINPSDFEWTIQHSRDRLELADVNVWDDVDATVNALALHCPVELGREQLTSAVWRAVGRYGTRRAALFAQFLREAQADVLAGDPEAEPPTATAD